MVGDTFPVADTFQKFGGLLTFRIAHFVGAELYQIGADDILIVVAVILRFPDILRQFRREVHQACQRVFQRLYGTAGHFNGHGPALAQGKGRGRQQALIQFHGLLGMPGIRDEPDGQLFQYAACGKQ